DRLARRDAGGEAGLRRHPPVEPQGGNQDAARRHPAMGRAFRDRRAAGAGGLMKLTPIPLQGAFVVDIEPLSDERGFFARTYCRDELAAAGFGTVAQCSVSFNKSRGTLRGMHYQAAPFEEDKLVRCTAGAIFDAVVDLRPDSPTYRQWFGI